MLIIPAIDLQDGCVVRFVQGRLNKKIYSRDPLKTAKHWVKSGAQLLHIVDLDGAITGVAKNLPIVKEIARAIDVKIEFGGGIRNMQTIKNILDSGIFRVVLGTKAIEDKDFLKKAFKAFGNKIIVGVDAKSANLVTRGWIKCQAKSDIFSFAQDLEKIGFKELIYTDTLKDGTLSGPNIKGTKELLKKSGLRIITSGGVSNLDDISKLKRLEKEGLSGIIIGKALYEGKFTLPEALKIG